MACGIEAVQRGGIAIVEFAERTDAVEPVDIDAIGEAGMFFFDLPPQRPQEIGHVRSPGGQRKDFRRAFHVARDGNGDCRAYLLRDSPVALPEILECLIAAHAEPHKYDAPVAEGDAVLHDKVQIVRFPAVVERKRVVHFA